jgi:hypothetical protein
MVLCEFVSRITLPTMKCVNSQHVYICVCIELCTLYVISIGHVEQFSLYPNITPTVNT